MGGLLSYNEASLGERGKRREEEDVYGPRRWEREKIGRVLGGLLSRC